MNFVNLNQNLVKWWLIHSLEIRNDFLPWKYKIIYNSIFLNILTVDVYSGSTNFLVHVTFNGEFLCGASLISNHNALTLYRKQFKAYCYSYLALMVPTDFKIFHIEYDKENPDEEKFAVIMVSNLTQNSRMQINLWLPSFCFWYRNKNFCYAKLYTLITTFQFDWIYSIKIRFSMRAILWQIVERETCFFSTRSHLNFFIWNRQNKRSLSARGAAIK